MIRPLFLLCGMSVLAACATTPEIQTFEENVSMVEKVIHSEVNIGDTYTAAQTAFDQEQYKTSLDLFNRIILRDPDHIGAKIGFGNAALAMGQSELARQQFLDLTREGLPDDQSDQVLAGLALADVNSGVSKDPVHRLTETLKNIPGDPRLWSAKGRALDEQGEWLAAQDAYIAALKTGRASSKAINNMGMSLLKQGRIDEAKAKFEQALELQPESRLYDNNRRLALFMQKDIIEGLREFPDDRAASLLNDAGFIALQNDEYALAEFLLEKAIEISPSYHVKAEENLKQVQLKMQSGESEHG